MSDKKQNVKDIIFNKLQEKIISGEWCPGTKIMSEPQLAQKLGVSRMSVREAIEKMVVLGMLEKKRGEGTFVSELTPAAYLNSLIPMITLDTDNYLEILEFRLLLDVQSASLCAKRASKEIIEELEEIYHDMVENQHDGEKFSEADTNFHLKVAEGTYNSLIIKVNQILKNLLGYHQTRLNEYLGSGGGITEHKLILEALKERDEELSALYMKRHILRTIHDIKKIPLQK